MGGDDGDHFLFLQMIEQTQSPLTPADVALMRGRGVHAFLVGEAFMRAPDPGAALTGMFPADGNG